MVRLPLSSRPESEIGSRRIAGYSGFICFKCSIFANVERRCIVDLSSIDRAILSIDHRRPQTKMFHEQAQDLSLKVCIDQDSEEQVHGVVVADRLIREQVFAGRFTDEQVR